MHQASHRPEAKSAPATASPAASLYRAVWRWHFYAGLLVLPFMILLATTGGLYLYKDEINHLVYRSYLEVEAGPGRPLPASTLIARATGQVPGEAVRLVPPSSDTDSAEIGVRTKGGDVLSVYVNPYSGAVLGTIADRSKLMWVIKKIHSLDYFGWLANRVIEIVAGWAIVLVITGFYLWWPRQRKAGLWRMRLGDLRLRHGPRRPWRDLHAVTGAYAGFFILFLALTGLPWSGFWGDRLNQFVNSNGLGYPPAYWQQVPKSATPMADHTAHTPWALEKAPMPLSMPGMAMPIGIDKAVAIFTALGLPKGYAIDLPDGPQGVYSASAFPDRVADERVVHLDEYSGAPLFDGGFRQLGIGAKAIEWGISVHQGQEFGLVNQLLMTAACLSIILMAIAAIAMWWKRRPRGSLGAPQVPADYRAPRVILGIALCIGLLFPLVGASYLVMLVLDRALPARLRAAFA